MVWGVIEPEKRVWVCLCVCRGGGGWASPEGTVQPLSFLGLSGNPIGFTLCFFCPSEQCLQNTRELKKNFS